MKQIVFALLTALALAACATTVAPNGDKTTKLDTASVLTVADLGFKAYDRYHQYNLPGPFQGFVK